MKRVLAAITIGSLMLGTGAVYAATTDALSQQDAQFLRQDARSSLAEMQMSKLAEKQATNPRIKQFAQQDVTEHTALMQQAQQIARRGDLMLPDTPTQTEQDEINSLKSKSGQAFDQAYLTDIKQINQHGLTEEQNEQKATLDPQLKQYTQKAENMDQKHLNTAKSL